MLRKEVRVVGIDDCPFDRQDREVMLVCTLFRGGEFMDGLLTTAVKRDGENSTGKIITMLKNCKWYTTLKCIFLDGIAVAGFNVIDAKRLHEETKIPVVIIMRDFPDYEKINAALDKIGMVNKKQLMETLPKPIKFHGIHFQPVGLTEKEAKEFIELTATRGHYPEPVRVAHLIAGGIKDGQSRGRA